MKTFIDSSTFLGLHSKDEVLRRACKQFFVEHFKSRLYMSLESVGKCDDIIWQFPREMQDDYYPFMDRLQTQMDIQRVSYTEETLARRTIVAGLSIYEQLSLAQLGPKDVLYTCNSHLLALGVPHVKNVLQKSLFAEEAAFPGDLEMHYRTSLRVRV